MTDNVLSVFVWGGLQVTIVALVGIAMSHLFIRRSPNVASSAICAGLVVCGLLTVLSPLPLHHVFKIKQSVRIGETHLDSSTEVAGKRTSENSEPLPDSNGHFAQLSLHEILSALRSVANTMHESQVRYAVTIRNMASLFVLFVLFGLIRLALEWRHLIRLKRNVVSIQDQRLTDRLRELCTHFEHMTIPKIGQSFELTDAAACGWFRPMIILPQEWNQWTDSERDAVLAHELAHLSRRDIPWRILTATIATMHFYNPIMHWLFRRLILAQEMSADQLAAHAVGPKQYLRSLSNLVIRRDNQVEAMTAPRIIPVFSGQLITRIKWLHSKEGIFEMTNTRPRRNGFLQFGLANLVLGLALLVTRGLAQPPADSPPQGNQNGDGIRITGSIEFSGNTNNTGSLIGVLSTDEMVFQNQPLQPQIVGEDNPFGMVVLHVNRALNNPQLRHLTQLINLGVSTEFAKEWKLETPLSIPCEEIDWIAARPVMTFQGKTKDQRGRLMFGVGGLTVKLRQTFNLSQWIAQHLPETKRALIDNVEVFELQLPFMGMGPFPICVWMQDETTIRTSMITRKLDSVTRLADINLNPPTEFQPSNNTTGYGIKSDGADSLRIELHDGMVRWSDIWGHLDRGLFSVLFSKHDAIGMKKELSNPELRPESWKDAIPPLEGLLSRCQMTGLSLDLAQNEPRVAIRLHLIHSSHESAEQSQRDMTILKMIIETDCTRQLESPTEANNTSDISDLKLMLALIGNAKISIEDLDDSVAQLLIATHLPLHEVSDIFSTPTTANSEQPERR